MKKNKINVILNASNQGNLRNTDNVNLYQTNIIGVFDDDYGENSCCAEEFPKLIKIKINKLGEIKISDATEMIQDFEIFTDRKVFQSEEGGCNGIE